MPILTLPLALLALVSLPTVAAIYWLRSRYRQQTVSSLLLWSEAIQPRQGGRRVQRIATPLLLLLELIALALLAVAAADPRMLAAGRVQPVVVILDDAYAMQATGADGSSPRELAARALERELRQLGPFAARFVLAGERPAVLGLTAQQPGEAQAVLAQWPCLSVRSDLPRAMALARELAGVDAKLLVLTDRLPMDGEDQADSGRVRWLALGQALPNVAFVQAARTRLPTGQQQVLLHVANLWDEPAHTTLTLGGRAMPLELAGGEVRPLRYDLPADAGPIEAVLGDDSLMVDNQVTLLPAARPMVRVGVDMADPAAGELIRRALEAVDQVVITKPPVHLLVTDRSPVPQVPAEAPLWVLQIRAASEPRPYAGPFVMDRAHPLTQGISLDGVIWPAPPTPPTPPTSTTSPTPAGPAETPGPAAPVLMPGRSIVTVGDIPLLTEAVEPGGGRLIRMQWQPEMSTLHQTPGFVSLLWNLANWRAAHLPGPGEPNIRLSVPLELAVTQVPSEARITQPDGHTRTLAIREAITPLQLHQPGMWEIATTDSEPWQVAVNVLSQQQSDLRMASNGELGNWLDEQTMAQRYRSIAWWVLLAALGVLTWHGWLVFRSTAGGLGVGTSRPRLLSRKRLGGGAEGGGR